MQALKHIHKFFQRMKHPISLPEDIGKDLGIQVLYNELSFEECIDRLASSCASKHLKRFQPREEVEPLFKTAVRKEIFKETSLFSYYLYDGWLAFKLIFDDQNRLRRVYIQHKELDHALDGQGLEMCIK